MKPKVLLEADVFRDLVAKEQCKVIRTEKIVFQGYTYVTEDESYYFCAYSPEPIDLPDDIEIINARNITF